MNRYAITLDLDKSKHPRSYMPVVLRRNDKSGCAISATITDHGDAIETDGLTPYIAARLPSGSYYRQTGEWVDGAASVTVDERYFASETGKAVMAYFELRSDDGLLIATTQNFQLKTIEDVTGEGELAEPYDSAIQDAIDRANDATSQAEAAIGMADEVIRRLHSEIAVVSNSEVDDMFIVP